MKKETIKAIGALIVLVIFFVWAIPKMIGVNEPTKPIDITDEVAGYSLKHKFHAYIYHMGRIYSPEFCQVVSATTTYYSDGGIGTTHGAIRDTQEEANRDSVMCLEDIIKVYKNRVEWCENYEVNTYDDYLLCKEAIDETLEAKELLK